MKRSEMRGFEAPFSRISLRCIPRISLRCIRATMRARFATGERRPQEGRRNAGFWGFVPRISLRCIRATALLAALYAAGAQAADGSGFTDVTAQSGISFRHVNGAFVADQGENSRYMPETLGSGVLVFDGDGDGDQDLLFVNGQSFDPKAQGESLPALYENRGNWRFVEITRQAGLNRPFYGMGAIAADYDGDGDPDILLTALDGLRLYRNERGRFSDVSREAGLRPVYWTDEKGRVAPEWSTAALMFDADGDGDIDILSAQYVKWSVAADIPMTYDAVHKGYATPRAYEGQSLRLWLQDKGRFRDATSGSGFALPGKALGLALWDFDADGRLDVVVANDTLRNFLFRNLGRGRFEEIGQQAGIAYGNDGSVRAGMGVDIADYLNDGTAGVAVGNFAEEPTSLFRMLKPWQFREDSGVNGIAGPTFPLLTFGLAFADLDLDGRQDIVTANGHIEPAIRTVAPTLSHAQPLQWLRNLGDGRFADAGSGFDALRTPMVGRGLAVGDLDGDGDLDIVATSNGGSPRLIRNDLAGAHYLRVRLRGTPPNADAIGARLLLQGSGGLQRRMVRTGGSYLSQSELTQTFGLAPGESVRRLEIRWPDGTVSTLQNPAADRTYLLARPRRATSRPARTRETIAAACVRHKPRDWGGGRPLRAPGCG
jgi:hypothetical protein